MSKLACNIVSYRPDPDTLAKAYRPWHAEALLNQAATLIDRCLEDFKYYTSLDYAWNRFHFELETQEKQVHLEKQRETEGGVDKETVPSEEMETPITELEETVEEPEAETTEEATDLDRTEGEPALAAAAAPPITSPLELRAEAVQRKKELAAPGQPFALNEQRDLTLRRLCRDYEGALDRACVAEEGLRKIYNHVELSSPIPSEAETLNTSISNLAMWIRDSIEWLGRYQQQEQAFTRVVSVRSLLGRNAWALLKHARDSYSLKVPIPADLFRSHENCRVRGIGALLVGEAGTVPWAINVRLPDEAVYERSGQSVEVDQSARPSCLLGRVESRRSIHPLEFCGATTLLNASPVGKSTPGGAWSLDIVKPGAISESFGHLEDLLLEISVVGTPQTVKN